MFPRRAIGVYRRRSVAILIIALVFSGSGKDYARAEEQKPAVVLELVKATAERLDSGAVLFSCTATLKNNSGVELQVRTNFFSVFDGMFLLVLGESGEKVHQQPYIFHQSPYSPEGRDLPLKTGVTRETLVFPVNGLPKDIWFVRLLLVGDLPGCNRSGLLCSGSVIVAILPEPK
jgi:hypothetical protein